jgi:radical SAM enzyme (TIGR01210 family)
LRPSIPDRAGDPPSSAYPEDVRERDRWIVSRRGARAPVDFRRAVDAFVEEERTERGDIACVATILLANRECPWRCLMCDLWAHTASDTVPLGAIPEQIRRSLAALPPAGRIKLYNAGSFFDSRAIPPEDFQKVAALLAGFERVIVESHPALVGPACRTFRDQLAGELEIAMGLETVHPVVLPLLNKRMTLDDFRRAAGRLAADGIALRSFVLLGLPFLRSQREALDWAVRSTEFAFDAGSTVVSIVPTRAGNGALDALAARGEFEPPTLETIEETAALALGLCRGRVFVDLWEIARFSRCAACLPDRTERLRSMNLSQELSPPVSCVTCGAPG